MTGLGTTGTTHSFGPFSVGVQRISGIDDAPSWTVYQLVVQFSARTSLQLLCVRFDEP